MTTACSPPGATGKRQPEGRASPFRTLHAHAPTVLPDNRLTNRESQPQPYPASALHLNSRSAVKALPGMGMFLLVKPSSPVADGHPHLCVRRFHTDRHRLPCIRIFKRIGEIVRHDLPDAIGIDEQELNRGYYFEGRSILWNRLIRRKVGGHWPTKMLQSRLPSKNRLAETMIDPRAAQYQTSSGTWSVTRKYCACAFCAVFVAESTLVAMKWYPFNTH